MKKSIFILLFAFVAIFTHAQIDSTSGAVKKVLIANDIHLHNNYFGGQNHWIAFLEIDTVDYSSGLALATPKPIVLTDSMYNVFYSSWNSGTDLVRFWAATNRVPMPSDTQRIENAFYNAPPFKKR